MSIGRASDRASKCIRQHGMQKRESLLSGVDDTITRHYPIA